MYIIIVKENGVINNNTNNNNKSNKSYTKSFCVTKTTFRLFTWVDFKLFTSILAKILKI